MELIPIKETLEGNKELLQHSLFQEIVSMSVDFHQRVGYVIPWVGDLLRKWSI